MFSISAIIIYNLSFANNKVSSSVYHRKLVSLSTIFNELLLKAMAKDKHIISELNTFFHKNDSNKAIHCIMAIINQLSKNYVQRRKLNKSTCET